MSKSIKSTNGTFKFKLRDSKSNTETSIIIDYSFGRNNRIRYSTGIKINPKYWDEDKQKVRAISTIENRDRINSKLKKINSDFFTELDNLDVHDKENKNSLKTVLDKVVRQKEVEGKEKVCFFTFADKFITVKKEQSEVIGSSRLSPITVRSYSQTVKKLKDFDKSKSYHLDFNKFDLVFYYDFVKYLEDKKFSLNTIGKHIKNLKTILNKATEAGVNTFTMYKHSEFKPIKEETTSIYLSQNEIDSMYNLDLADNRNLEIARDIFIIGYYIGQRVSDYNGLSKSQIMKFDGVDVLEINQKKVTGTVVYVPIHKRVKEIMERYNYNFPPKIYDHELNEWIKIVAKKSKIKDVVYTRRTIGGKLNVKDVVKHELVGSHTARRSFCTNAYLAKMPVIDIMAISGHKTEKEFYKYIRVTPQERAVKIAQSKFFN